MFAQCDYDKFVETLASYPSAQCEESSMTEDRPELTLLTFYVRRGKSGRQSVAAIESQKGIGVRFFVEKRK